MLAELEWRERYERKKDGEENTKVKGNQRCASELERAKLIGPRAGAS
jgi:hypothetical protein